MVVAFPVCCVCFPLIISYLKIFGPERNLIQNQNDSGNGEHDQSREQEVPSVIIFSTPALHVDDSHTRHRNRHD